jgi:hypothetical protein
VKQFNQDEVHFGREITDYLEASGFKQTFRPGFINVIGLQCLERKIVWRTKLFLKIRPERLHSFWTSIRMIYIKRHEGRSDQG